MTAPFRHELVCAGASVTLAALLACTAAEPKSPVATTSTTAVAIDHPLLSPVVPACAALHPSVPDVVAAAKIDPPVPAIDSPEALDGFYRALAELARGRAKDHVRIAVFGDSNLTMDFPTGHLRRALQARFGDGGHGFVALGKPWSHYRHMDVRHDVVSGWHAYAVTTSPTGDGLYGLAGIAVENRWQGATTFVATAPQGAPVGTRAGLFDVFFLTKPKGGAFEVRIDGSSRGRTETGGETHAMGVTHVATDDAPHRLEVIARSPATVRLFGVALERDAPGIVIDTFGVGSLNTKTMTRYDPTLQTEMLRDRRYDLIVYMTGANDLFTMDSVPESLHELMTLQREALPSVSFLILTPADRGRGKSFAPTLEVVEQRRVLAKREGAAFWDLWSAMGGRSSMKRFVDAKLAYDDAVHFTDAGGAFIAGRLDHALMDGFTHYLDAHPDAGCAEPETVAGTSSGLSRGRGPSASGPSRARPSSARPSGP